MKSFFRIFRELERVLMNRDLKDSMERNSSAADALDAALREVLGK